MTLSLDRFYDSFEGQKSLFGFGWKVDPLVAKFEKPAYVNSTFPGGLSLDGLREGDVRVLDRATGQELIFRSALEVTKTAGGSFIISGRNLDGTADFSAVGDTDGSTFEMNTDQTYLLTRANSSSVLFDTNGKILKQTDRFGKFLAYTYSGSELSVITDSQGRSITLTYDGNGRITQADGPLGLSVTYAYNAQGDLTSVTDVRTGLVTQYSYDADHNLTGSVDPFGYNAFDNEFQINGTASGQTDVRGNDYTRIYDMALRKETVTSETLGESIVREYDAKQRVTKETDYLGQITSYTYSGENRLPSSVTDPKGHTVNFTYDTKGRVKKIMDPANLNSFGATQEFTYDSKGNVTWMRDARDVVTTLVYDSASNVTEIRETLNTSETRVTKFAYDSAGNLTSVTDAGNHTRNFIYDVLGNLLETQDASGITEERRTYDELFRLTGTEDALGRGTEFAYNNRDQLTSVETVFGTVTYDYDAQGNLETFTDASGNETTYTYDPTTGNLLQVIDATGKTVQYTYDAFGRIASFTDANGLVTVFEYDAMGRTTYIGADLF